MVIVNLVDVDSSMTEAGAIPIIVVVDLENMRRKKRKSDNER